MTKVMIEWLYRTNRGLQMGMYTEFRFRAKIKDGEVADWLTQQIDGEDWFQLGFDDHKFFTLPRWRSVFMGGGAVYQLFQRAEFDRAVASYEDSWLVLQTSLKNYGDEIGAFINWISPHLDMHYGDFLGYSLYEDSCDDADLFREHPTLYFFGRDSVYA